MRENWGRYLSVFGLLIAAAGCNQIAGIREGTPRQENDKTDNEDEEIGKPACLVAADCPIEELKCRVVACEAGQCVVEDACICVPGESVPCYSGAPGTENAGACHGGMSSCDPDGLGYGPCIGEQTPQAEACDAEEIDEDCDGKLNEEGANCACGDGYISNMEECDDENDDPTDLCSPACALSICGDGIVQPDLNEGCDDANDDPTDLCSPVCAPSVCGDGVVQPVLNENCDDGGTLDGDACSQACREQRVVDASAGYEHTCARLSEGILKCWGLNAFGKLGLGDTLNRGDEPKEMGGQLPSVNVDLGEKVAAVAAGLYHTCALLSDGRVKCWGHNANGQLGLGNTSDRGDGSGEMGADLPAVDLGSGKTATAVAVGGSHSCAILSDGSVKCWGKNLSGQLGLGNTVEYGDGQGDMGANLPAVSLGSGKAALAIGVGASHTCALLNDGTVKCWGLATNGRLGLGDIVTRGDNLGEMGNNLAVVPLGTGKSVVAIDVGGAHACALLNDGSIKCWGDNTYGQLGLGDTLHRGDEPNEMGDSLPAIDVGAGKTAVAVQTGYYHTCALLNNGDVKCWGYNNGGVLGLGVPEDIGDEPGEMGDNLPAVSLGAGKSVAAIYPGTYHTCARFNDGSLKCWGHNSVGELGLGDTLDRGANSADMGDNLPTTKVFSDFW